MLNRTPPKSSNVINAYRKRRLQRGPLLMYGAIALAVLGAILLLIWLTRPDQPLGPLFATDTPTPTLTFTPTNTLPPTETPTITTTPTQTVTSTPSEPFPYTIQEGDTLDAIAQKFNLGGSNTAFCRVTRWPGSPSGSTAWRRISSRSTISRIPTRSRSGRSWRSL